MRNLIYILLCFVIFSCENPVEVQNQIGNLDKQRNELSKQVSIVQDSVNRLLGERANLQKQNAETKIIATGNAKYILKLHLRQISYSLSISKQIRDAVNAIDFEIPVDKDYYNSVQVGQEIVDNFRWGSLLMRSSFGNWRMTVEEKTIK